MFPPIVPQVQLFEEDPFQIGCLQSLNMFCIHLNSFTVLEVMVLLAIKR